jgi:predicted amino acid dehydrogenase
MSCLLPAIECGARLSERLLNQIQANRRTMMYAITGITGKVGVTVARALLAAGQPVRAVVRDAKKGEA